MRLWDWAARAYAAPRVAALCLRLQDEAGQSVGLLLWAAWAAANGRAIAPESLAEAAALARTWEGEVLGPLRAARRALKAAPGVGEAERAALRDQAKAVELAAEEALLAALEALTPAGSGAGDEPRAALTAASAAFGPAAPTALLASLADALPRGADLV